MSPWATLQEVTPPSHAGVRIGGRVLSREQEHGTRSPGCWGAPRARMIPVARVAGVASVACVASAASVLSVCFRKSVLPQSAHPGFRLRHRLLTLYGRSPRTERRPNAVPGGALF